LFYDAERLIEELIVKAVDQIFLNEGLETEENHIAECRRHVFTRGKIGDQFGEVLRIHAGMNVLVSIREEHHHSIKFHYNTSLLVQNVNHIPGMA
jgi:hypothetical protein